MSLNKRIKITFVLPTLFAGGSERIASYLAQNIDKNQFEATLIVMGKSSDSAYEIDCITVVFFEKARVLNAIPKLYQYLKKTKPDIVISFISHLNTSVAYLSLVFPKVKFIARESTVLSVDDEIFKDKRKSLIHGFLGNNRFNFFDKIICQSNDMLIDIKKNYKVNDEKLIVINNPITRNYAAKNNATKNIPIKLITIARFSKEKGLTRILEILSKFKVPFNYTLIGDGPEKKNIMLIIKKYHLQDKITAIPFTRDVDKYLVINDYFLQGSYVEGFPNALLESCSLGTPVIAFNAPGGTKEIVEDGVNGFLVNDETEFLERLNETRVWDPEKVRASVFKKFNKEKIIDQYEQLFLDILK